MVDAHIVNRGFQLAGGGFCLLESDPGAGDSVQTRFDDGRPGARGVRIITSMKKLVLSLLCAQLAFPADTGPLRGFSNDGARTQREWEAKFRAIPDPANLRSYMQRLSARPHHVGSPYGKDNAEWMLAKFKEWGLDAQLEIFDVLFPTPKERLLELVEPT